MKNLLEIDVRRCCYMYPFIQEWGEPVSRFVFDREENEVEIFFFQDTGPERLSRFLTFGVSMGTRSAARVPHEICMTLTDTLGGATEEEVALLLMNIAEYSYREDVSFRQSMIIPVPFLPGDWGGTSVLISTAVSSSVTEVNAYGETTQIYEVILLKEPESLLLKSGGYDHAHFIARVRAGSPATLDPWRLPLGF